MLSSAKSMGLHNIVVDMIEGNLAVCGKKAWSKMGWEKAWMLEDVFWDSSKLIHRDNNLLYGTVGHTRYMSWWRLADLYPPLIRMCENMATLVCHASNLKCDDARLKGLSQSNKACWNLVENVYHMIMQCPMHVEGRRAMYDDLYEYDPMLEAIFAENPEKIFY